MLENLKKQIIRISLESQRLGLCKHKSGNFSIIDRNTNYIVVSPSGIDRELLEIDDIVVMDLENNIIECKEGVRPSSEVMMHIEIYKKRLDINSVVHTHSKMATSFAVVNKKIPIILFELAVLGLKEDYIPVAKYFMPGTKELAQSVSESLLKADVSLMEKHGAISVGIDINDAFLKAQYLEEISEIYFNSLMLNGGKELDKFEIKELNSWKYPEEIKSV